MTTQLSSEGVVPQLGQLFCDGCDNCVLCTFCEHDDDKVSGLQRTLVRTRFRMVEVFSLTELPPEDRRRRYARMRPFSVRSDLFLPFGEYVGEEGEPAYLDESPESLASYLTVHAARRRELLKPSDLPWHYRRLPQKEVENLLEEMHYLLMRHLVKALAEHPVCLWSHCDGWQAARSFVDELATLRRIEFTSTRRRKRRVKSDMRPFHGRPGRDRKNGTIPGVSIGYAQ